MSEISEMIRWNAGFIRGLAQSVLDRAKLVRSSLASSEVEKSASGSKSAKSTLRKAKSKVRVKSKAPAKGKRSVKARAKKTVHG